MVPTVKTLRVKEQHIAVFGRSGSGKTVLVSSFYGGAQEPHFLQESLFHVLADDISLGNRLRQNYLGMRNAGQVPQQTRFAATPYSFTVKLKDNRESKNTKAKPFDALRLVWHDYPGEWFEEEPSSTEESNRRLDTFRALLKSDVALVLVDGQKLLDYAGEEEKYLKELFWGLRDGLLRLREDLLVDGKRLTTFPRVWVLGLSKADVLPHLDAQGFGDLVIEKAAAEVAQLHEVLMSLVKAPRALSIGEDFMLLSSAKFEPGRIEVTQRVGVDLLLPVAALLPLERFVQWARVGENPRKLLDGLVENSDSLVRTLTESKFLGDLLGSVPRIGPLLNATARPALAAALRYGGAKVKALNVESRAKGDYATAALTQFKLDLDGAVEQGTLVKSLR